LKEEALDGTVWKARFGTLVRQTAKWMKMHYSWGLTSVRWTWPPYYVFSWRYCRLIVETRVELRLDSHLTADLSGRSQHATDARRIDAVCRAWWRDGHCPYLQPTPGEGCLLRLYSSCNVTDTGRRFSRDCRLRTGSSVVERRVLQRNWHKPNVPYLKDNIVCSFDVFLTVHHSINLF
jgi:hypothetical protein